MSQLTLKVEGRLVVVDLSRGRAATRWEPDELAELEIVSVDGVSTDDSPLSEEFQMAVEMQAGEKMSVYYAAEAQAEADALAESLADR